MMGRGPFATSYLRAILNRRPVVSTNVNKIIEKAVGQVRTILVDAAKQVDEEARADLITRFNQTVTGDQGIVTVKAQKRRVTAKPKKKPTKKASLKSKAKSTKKTEKPKRVVSEATRRKLAENLRKAREAKAAKTKPGSTKKNGKSARKAAPRAKSKKK